MAEGTARSRSIPASSELQRTTTTVRLMKTRVRDDSASSSQSEPHLISSASMLSRIGAKSYRCFSRLDVELPQHAVLTGANGIGKSTLLDIPVLIADMLSGGLQRSILERIREGQGPRAQTYRDVLHRSRGDRCSLSLEARLPPSVIDSHRTVMPPRLRSNPPTHIRYELQLRLTAEDQMVIDSEFLDLVPNSTRASALSRGPNPLTAGWRSVIERLPGQAPSVQAEFRREKHSLEALTPDQLALSALQDSLLYPAASWLVGFLKQGTVPYSPDCSKLRQARPPGPAEAFRCDATILPWQVLGLSSEKREEWVHIVQLALSSVLDVEARQREEDHHAYLKVTYRYGDDSAVDHAVTSSGLSDGTLRILAYTILPYLSSLPPLLTIEEPEDGIHPKAIDVVLESLTSLPSTQTLITTHSPVVLARTPLSQLICLRRDDEGAAEAIQGTDHPRLKDWKQELDLGVLFAAGVLS